MVTASIVEIVAKWLFEHFDEFAPRVEWGQLDESYREFWWYPRARKLVQRLADEGLLADHTLL